MAIKIYTKYILTASYDLFVRTRDMDTGEYPLIENGFKGELYTTEYFR